VLLAERFELVVPRRQMNLKALPLEGPMQAFRNLGIIAGEKNKRNLCRKIIRYMLLHTHKLLALSRIRLGTRTAEARGPSFSKRHADGQNKKKLNR
jgi:hypothetical protein